jgi:hypothetical protein
MFRFRIVGEYLYAWSRGWIDLFVDFSEIYAEFRRRRGMPVLVVPWGTARNWYDDLKLERDIDVLWMGRQRTRRRRRLLDQVRNQLAKRGVEVYVADNEENPFIFGQERTHFLNRAKVTLNLKTVWYDNVFSTRFHMAAGNRSLVASESFLPHHGAYQDGVHYVSAPPEALAETVLFYLDNEAQRHRIVENAYQLATVELTLKNSIKAIMQAVDEIVSPV